MDNKDKKEQKEEEDVPMSLDAEPMVGDIQLTSKDKISFRVSKKNACISGLVKVSLEQGRVHGL